MPPKLYVKQRITLFVNRYEIYNATPDGSQGDLIAFAQQKRFEIVEKFDFFKDATMQERLFTMRAEKILDIHGKYFVEDNNGNLIGQFKKAFQKSLLRSTWEILDLRDNPVITVQESSLGTAIIRRLINLIPIPYIDDLVSLAFQFLLKYHFTFSNMNGDSVGYYTKTRTIRDDYRLTMQDQAYGSQDWRLYAAFAVALDALQSR